MSAANFHDNFQSYVERLGVQAPHGNEQDQAAVPASEGEGYIRRVIPRNDIELVVAKHAFYREQQLSVQTTAPMVELNFCMQGARALHIKGRQHEFTTGTCSLQFMGQFEAAFEYRRDDPFYMLGIGIPVTTFREFMADAEGGTDVEFSQVLGQSPFRIWQEKISPAATVVAERLIQGALQPRTRNLELQCGALELFSMAFRSFLTELNPEADSLSKSDREKIRLARDIVVENMAEPPSLLALSRMIGLNDYKLKVGFKAMYNNTVFGFLREKRLEKAWQLLQSGDMNVTETASAVGYSNTSYFAEAFREKYGVNPGAFVRQTAAWAKQ
ncbi:helix-turn-helix transcriptional regulator [Brevibacillus parabrevis]|uniref:helix-turn-helix transcriptional regulator n=1 Tax=Brevibacillus parabrevis TaxID=54914 RepID=UPI001F5FFF0D|nr:AraC family transcriptional regulator [Brevibacillus parabrevis]MDR4999665.1 AraC family transcriptional regulator [Brevibacillus parabrevis]